MSSRGRSEDTNTISISQDSFKYSSYASFRIGVKARQGDTGEPKSKMQQPFCLLAMSLPRLHSSLLLVFSTFDQLIRKRPCCARNCFNGLRLIEITKFYLTTHAYAILFCPKTNKFKVSFYYNYMHNVIIKRLLRYNIIFQFNVDRRYNYIQCIQFVGV